GRRKRGTVAYQLLPADPSAFAQNFDAAVGPVDFASQGVATLLDYNQEIETLEGAFYMPADDFAYMMAVYDAGGPTEKEWRRVDDLLGEAYARKVYAARRAGLLQIGEGAARPADGLAAALCQALGQAPPPADVLALIEKLRDFGTTSADIL